ncbi:TetR/AcrR family transcriptional regulator [Bacillus suaedaesalsae]|uniref:TetR family transcriptional regulator n=1 Tax=Bacillus suaedaesalsae TaxID=2810349 RepID=A0ABS2DPF6_9BACI|nr:TetR/AcrR family transcriptional regulator [Bacillus suaedaesalsae]MBM6619558.1 TetR family transcriptional regulator [Bacillus suaedaesalsae]
MPKQTFLHLDKEKQNILIQAAKKEFSRVSLHEASIANIIKSAGIPRGSFYQYFDDKEDLYFYLLDEMTKETNERFIILLKERNGDLIETISDFFQLMVNNRGSLENKEFFKNAFVNMNYKIENTLAKNIYEKNQKEQYIGTLRLINRENLNVQDERELHHLIKLLISVTFHNLVEMYVRDLTSNDALANFNMEIDLLKRGIYKGCNH